MIKHFCDFCGKDITAFTKQTIIKIGDRLATHYEYEVCESCLDAVRSEIENIRIIKQKDITNDR